MTDAHKTEAHAPRWADPENRTIRVATADGAAWIPADPLNADYAALLDTDAAVEPFARFQTLAQARVELTAAVEGQAERRLRAAAGSAEPAKLAVYQWKAEIAEGGKLEALAPEAAARGVTPADLALLILTKAAVWRELGLAIDAAAAAHRKEIEALSDLAQAEAYDVTAGWPEQI